MLQDDEKDVLRRMAEQFFGYGSFDRPYWYVGTEPGGEDEQVLRGKLRSWAALGAGELVCNRQHHLGFGFQKWHAGQPPLQSTWRPLMLATLSLKGVYADSKSARAYMKAEQAMRFGCDAGDSALLELGALPARNVRSWPYKSTGIAELATRERYVDAFLLPRAQRIAREARLHQPKLVWMFGSRQDYRGYWHTIAGGDFDTDALGYWYRTDGRTLYAVTDHVTHHQSNDHWLALGTSFRARIDALRS